jgi:hypothetical protein
VGANKAEQRGLDAEASDAKAQEQNGPALFYLLEKWRVELVNTGDELRGITVSRRDDGWLLTVRVRIDGILQVAFVHRDTPTGCVRVAAVKAKEGTLSFRPDKFS